MPHKSGENVTGNRTRRGFRRKRFLPPVIDFLFIAQYENVRETHFQARKREEIFTSSCSAISGMREREINLRRRFFTAEIYNGSGKLRNVQIKGLFKTEKVKLCVRIQNMNLKSKFPVAMRQQATLEVGKKSTLSFSSVFLSEKKKRFSNRFLSLKQKIV